MKACSPCGAAGSRGSEDTPPRLPFPPQGPHPFRGRRGRVPGPGIHLGGVALGSENGPSPSLLLWPEPTPIRRPPNTPAWAQRVERSQEQSRAPPGRTVDQRFPIPSSRRGTPGARKCHRPTSPRAVPAQALSTHTSPETHCWAHGRELSYEVSAEGLAPGREPSSPMSPPHPRGRRPRASALIPSPQQLDVMGARGR